MCLLCRARLPCNCQKAKGKEKVDDSPTELTERGGAKNQTRDWTRTSLLQTKYYIHFSGTPPGTILESGLDPTYGQENIRLLSEENGTGSKYVLAFPAKNNMVPDKVPAPGAIKSLWGDNEIKYVYCFRWERGRTIYAKDGYQGNDKTETGFKELIPAENIVGVYQLEKNLNGQRCFLPHPIRLPWIAIQPPAGPRPPLVIGAGRAEWRMGRTPMTTRPTASLGGHRPGAA